MPDKCLWGRGLRPGPEEAAALEVAEEIAPAPSETVRVAVSRYTGKQFLAVVDSLPEHLTGAIWSGFLRGMAAHAGGAPVHVHEEGRA